MGLKKHRPLRCLHLGHIYEGRRIDTFCAALSMLTKKQMLDPDAVKVLFVGDTDESQIAACRQVASELMDSRMIVSSLIKTKLNDSFGARIYFWSFKADTALRFH